MQVDALARVRMCLTPCRMCARFCMQLCVRARVRACMRARLLMEFGGRRHTLSNISMAYALMACVSLAIDYVVLAYVAMVCGGHTAAVNIVCRTHVYTHVYTHASTHVYTHADTHIYTHADTHVYTHVKDAQIELAARPAGSLLSIRPYCRHTRGKRWPI